MTNLETIINQNRNFSPAPFLNNANDSMSTSKKKAMIPEGVLPAYLASAFGDLYQDDGLMVMAKGLGWLDLLAAFVRFYGDVNDGYLSMLNEEHPKVKRTKPPLVMVLGLKDAESAALCTLLQTWGTPHQFMPKILTNEMGGSEDRAGMYARGGVFCITSRILIVDLLTNTISSNDIDGMLIAHADQVTNDSTSAFIIRIFTSQKRRDKCFIKAFTDKPESLTAGFAKVNKTLKALQVQNMFLYPRFHDHVKEELEKNQPDVVELHQTLSPAMNAIQNALVSAVKTCLDELKKSTPLLEWNSAELSIENCVTNNFDLAVSRQLEKDWHQLKPETKQLSQDLKTLRRLFQTLIRYDCIQFYSLINSIKTMSASSRNPSMWLLTPAADVLFKKAKERIYRIKKGKPTAQIPNPVSRLVPVLEENPKWRLLKKCLSEIEEIEKKRADTRPSTILVMAKDEHTVDIIQTYLHEGKDRLLSKRWHRYLENVNDRSRSIASSKISEESRLLLEEEGRIALKLKRFRTETKRPRQLNEVPDFLRKRRRVALEKNRGRTLGSLEDREREAVLEEAVDKTEHNLEYANDPLEADTMGGEHWSEDAMFATSFVEGPRIVLKSLSSAEADGGASLLQDLMPDYVVLYDYDIVFIRALEVYSALNSLGDDRLKIYFLVFSASAETKVFKKSLEREQASFERLIHHKRTMPPPVLSTGGTQELQHATSGGIIEGTYNNGTMPLAFDSRQGRRREDSKLVKRDIAVDVREFRSALPAILHQGGMRLAPLTLTVGDFVLSSVHCVERKSISDLFGSFASGRLYTQAEAMSKFYKCPALLIEFDPEKSFSLINSNELGMDIRADSICSKMVILTLHFPKLRILWSKSPHESLRIFKALKANHDEVDVEMAAEIGRNESVDALLKVSDDEEEDKVNEAARDMLLSLPGVNVNNARKIMRECESLAELSTMDRAQLRKIAGPLAGQKLFSFFRQKINSV